MRLSGRVGLGMHDQRGGGGVGVDAVATWVPRGGASGCVLERGAARVDSSQFRLAPFDRPVLKIFKHNFKNLEYQSCRATKGEHFS